MFKFADDTNLLVPEHTDVTLQDEFANVIEWARRNKMVINFAKTKETVTVDFFINLDVQSLKLAYLPN
jgi:hypothetical protein